MHFMTANISTYVWPGQTYFGFGAAKLVGQEARALGAKSAFILSDPGVIAARLLEPVMESLMAADLAITTNDKIPPNPDIDSVDAATAAFRESGADVIIAVGGGSVLDAAKGVRLAAGGPENASVIEYSSVTGVEARPAPFPNELSPMLAIPTTAGTGSEVTPWGVLTDVKRKLKFGIGGPYLVPNVALVDPEMTLTLPPWLTAATGLDALSHCIEAYVSTNQNSALDPMILHGIELIGSSLRQAFVQPTNRSARHDMMLASMIAGVGISSKWLGACHSLAHQLSTFAEVHHGAAIALMLPHQMAFSLPGAEERYGDIGSALEGRENWEMVGAGLSRRERAERAVTAVRELICDVGLPTQLRDVGVTMAMIPPMAENAYQRDGNWPTNPQLINQSDFEDLYQKAY
jgi:alcohol dehydrogenase class IV